MANAASSTTETIPSRASNPFATYWTRPGAIPFHFPAGISVEQLIARLATLNWRAAIIGPHGSGKSTLLETLKPLLTEAGHRVAAITLRDGQRSLPSDYLGALATQAKRQQKPQQTLAIVDGYEQLSWLQRWRLMRLCRRVNIGLLVTAHAATRLPALIELAPDRALVTQLAGDLCGGVSNCITPEIVAASHACHGSNVREIFFDLYDRYERSRRTA